MMLGYFIWFSLGWLLRLGGPGLLGLGVVHSFFPVPGGMDVALVLLSAHRGELWWYYGAMALAGDLTGAYLNYRVARKGGKEALEKKVSPRKSKRAISKFEQYGGWGLLVGAWMPPPMPWIPFLAAAGALQYPARKFMAVVTLGRGTRYFALAWVGQRYGEWILSVVNSYRNEILYTLLALGVALGIGLLVYFKWYRPRHQQPEEGNKAPQETRSSESPAEAGLQAGLQEEDAESSRKAS